MDKWQKGGVDWFGLSGGEEVSSRQRGRRGGELGGCAPLTQSEQRKKQKGTPRKVGWQWVWQCALLFLVLFGLWLWLWLWLWLCLFLLFSPPPLPKNKQTKQSQTKQANKINSQTTHDLISAINPSRRNVVDTQHLVHVLLLCFALFLSVVWRQEPSLLLFALSCVVCLMLLTRTQPHTTTLCWCPSPMCCLWF